VYVVKLGGSLARSPELRPWLAVLAQAGGGRAVLVPGGGPFADAVRETQALQRFDDVHAHRMALLAMEQYGLMLVGLESALVAAATPEEIRRALVEGRVPVWMPSAMVLGCAGIPATWDVTSDTLAAWLAGMLGAPLLVLIKSVRVSETQLTLGQLAARGWVDPGFPRFAVAAGCAVRLLGSSEQPALTRMLASGVAEGLEVRE
jgi:5-(aminomethyl)-3-furanmethanol phosphate kinase